MEPTLPHRVRVILIGHHSDLLRTLLFIEGVLAGESPADSLANARLGAIKITSERRHAGQVHLTFHLEEADE